MTSKSVVPDKAISWTPLDSRFIYLIAQMISTYVSTDS